jgi:hypothetical protein
MGPWLVVFRSLAKLTVLRENRGKAPITQSNIDANHRESETLEPTQPKEVSMPSITTFVHRVQSEVLRSYFEKNGFVSADDVDWLAKPRELAAQIKKLSSNIGDEARARLLNDIERISDMSDDAGQAALLGFAVDHRHLAGLPGGHARSAWIFINEPALFRRGEEARYSDERRRGRHWSGYEGEPQLALRRSQEALEGFKAAIRDHYKSQNVHVDLFERQKTTFKKETFLIIQATIYRDGFPDDVPEFVDGGQLAWRPRKPVYEAAVTYEPQSGSVEVVAHEKESHSFLADTFAQRLLGTQSGQSPLPLKEYDLDILLRPYSFPTDAEDGIESVRVTQLRLMPFDSEGDRLTLECAQRSPHTIWDMAEQQFGGRDPLAGGWFPTKAKIVIRFHPSAEARRGKVLPVTVAMPNGCDLKDRTVHENMIGLKYLQRWQLVKDVTR